MSPLNAAICTTISYTLWVEWYYLKNNYLTWRSKVKAPRRSLLYVTHHLMVMHPHTIYHWPISKDKCYGPEKKILLKKQLFDLEIKGQGPTKVIMVCDTPPYGHAHFCWIYLTLRSKVKLMVMYPHTKYHWPISKDKKVMVRTSFAEKKRKKKITLKQYVSLRSKRRHKY